jgi:murein L,D-transpeptidase YafK
VWRNAVNYTILFLNYRVFMLQIGLSLRFCLVLCLSFVLWSCASQPPVVNTVSVAGGGASEKVVVIPKKCPASLLSLTQQQAIGLFLTCNPAKDGTVFVDEKSNYTVPPDHQSVWLLIDTQKMLLEVKRGDRTVAAFPNIAIGRSGSGFKNHRGDNITPVGEYKIGWINEQSQFHIFYGLTYPSVQNAKEAFSKGLVSESEYAAIIYAHEHGQIPPQNTSLGGQVGVHGLGRGDENIHNLMNWTHGCIALTNNQVDELDRWIVEGMRVKIK